MLRRLLPVLLIMAFFQASALAAETVVIKIQNVAFVPARVVVEPGTTIRWVNLDPVDHDVTSGTVVSGRKARQVKKAKHPDGLFHSGAFGKGGTFEVTLSEKGDYPYYCNIHPIMTGVVIVR